MDITKFTAQKTGELIKVNLPPADWAFVPAPLPPDGWEFPIALWPLLSEANGRLQHLDGIGRTLPNPELLIRPLQSRESIRSSSLEGTFATPEDLMLFAMNPREPRSDNDPANAWLEVNNYGLALREGLSGLSSRPLSLNLLKDMHRRLLQGVRGKEKAPGSFRRHQNIIDYDRRYIPPPVQCLESLLDNLQTHMNIDKGWVHPLIRAYAVHYQFEAIHPFMDGNGRVGRALLALMVFVGCGHQMPWLYMSAFFEKFKDQYIEKMFRVSARGEWDEWFRFCLTGTIEQADDAIVRCDYLRMLHTHYKQRLGGAASTRAHVVVDELLSEPMLTIASHSKRHGVSYPTAKKDIEYLVGLGILRRLEGIYPSTFYAPEIFKIAYHDQIEVPPSLDGRA